MSSKLLIIDTFGLIFRAFHAYPMLTTSDGRPTNAIFGFMQMLLSTIEKQNPTHLLCSLESTTPTFRHVLATEYKANRKPAAEELKIQIGDIKDIIETLNIPILQKDGYEADDVIGSFAIQHAKDFDEIKILTGDRDLFQLLGDNIRILMPGRFFSDLSEYDRQKFEQKYNIGLEDFVLYKSLIGDTSDNIKGIPGIGPKTAEKIVNEYHAMEAVLANLDELPPKVAESISENQNLWADYYRLCEIDTKIALNVKPDDAPVSKINVYKLRNIAEKYELKSLQTRIGKFIDKFEERYGGFGLFADDSQSLNQMTELNITITDAVAFEKADEGSNISGPKKAFVLIASNPERLRLGNGEDFIEIALTEESSDFLFNFIIKNQIRKFVGFDMKPFIKRLLGAGIEHIENYEFVDLKLAWYVIKHNIVITDINDLVRHLANDDYKILEKETIDRLEKESLTQLFKLEKDLQKVIAYMEFTGITCDKEYLNKLGEEFQERIDAVKKQIHDFVGFEFNINSTKELCHVLYDVLKLPQLKKIKTGVSTDDRTLTKLEDQSPIIGMIKTYRMYTKALSTYIIGLKAAIGNDEKIHTTFNQTTVATGRLSSINPNLQNLPGSEEIGSAIRKAFIPSGKSRIFISFDYSQIDLRVLAHESDDPALIEAFENDDDIHTTTAQIIFDKNEVTREERNFAKTINFGIMYGMEPYGLSQALKIDQKMAKDFIDRYLDRFSGVRKYFEKIEKQLNDKQYVNTFLDRKRYFPTWKSASGMQKRSLFREAINMPIQGGSSEIIKIAMIQIFDYINKENIKADMILQIHDELVFDVDKKENLVAFKDKVKSIMTNAYSLKVPLKVSTKEGNDLRLV